MDEMTTEVATADKGSSVEMTAINDDAEAIAAAGKMTIKEVAADHELEGEKTSGSPAWRNQERLQPEA